MKLVPAGEAAVGGQEGDSDSEALLELVPVPKTDRNVTTPSQYDMLIQERLKV